jgi:hypothetical protein
MEIKAVLILFPWMVDALVAIFYPLVLFLWEWDRKDILFEPSNRGKVQQEALLEFYIVESVNAMRAQMDKPPIDHHPVIADFHGREWEVIRVRCRQMVLGSLRKLAWIKEVMS